MVTRNADEVKQHLQDELETDNDALSILGTLGPKLLDLLTGDRAVALNRAAAADSSGELGAAISQSGREAVFPLLKKVLEIKIKEKLLLYLSHSNLKILTFHYYLE